MNFKKSWILIIAMLILMFVSLQTIAAEDNATSIEDLSVDDEIKDTTIEQGEKESLSEGETQITIEPVSVSSTYQTGEFTFKITNTETGEAMVNKSVTFSMPVSGPMVSYKESRSVQTDNNGIATFYLNTMAQSNYNTDSGLLNAGEYNLTVSGGAGLKGNLTTLVVVEKANVVITANPYVLDLGQTGNYTMTVRESKTNTPVKAAVLSITLQGGDGTVNTIETDMNGVGQIPVNLTGAGDYTLIISTDDANLNACQTTGKITINRLKTIITIESIVQYYNSGDTVVLRITDMNKKPIYGMDVQILIDGISYVRNPDKDGRIKFSTSVNVGTHTMTINIGGTTYSGSLTKKFTVKKASAKFTSSSKTVYYKSGKFMITKLTNTKTKKAIFNAKIRMKVKTSKTQYSTFYGTTGPDGKIKFNVNLKPGNYKIEISGDDSKSFSVKKIVSKITVKKSPVKLSAKKSGKSIQIKIINKKSKKTVSGAKLKIKDQSGKKYKVYIGKSNSKGLIKIKAGKGSHKVTVSVADSYYSSKALKKTIKI